MGVLTVLLDKLTDLRDTEAFRMTNPGCILNPSDPIVIFHLKRDSHFLDTDYGTRQSSDRKHEAQNPIYNETFTFEDIKSLHKLVLHVKVVDRDDEVGSTMGDALGTCSINLEEINPLYEAKEYSQRIDDTGSVGWFSKDARIHLKLLYKGE